VRCLAYTVARRVHFYDVSAFAMKTVRKRRKDGGLSLLASWLKKDPRTLSRWIADRPELRSVLRVKRHGKQWRIHPPKKGEQRAAWIEQVRQAVASFVRTPKHPSEFASRVCAALGFGDLQRERDVEILRHAMLLKRLDAPRNAAPHESEEFHAALDGEHSGNLPATELNEWKSASEDFVSVARIVAAKFRCRVEAAPSYWGEFLLHQRRENQHHNAAVEVRLKERGFHKTAMQLLDDNPHAAWSEFQLLHVMPDAEIQAERDRVNELWPGPKHWQRAREDYRRGWQLETLANAALELVRDEAVVNGENLAPLLFRNSTVQDLWKLHQQHIRLQKLGINVICVRERCSHGTRGIAERTFRERYREADIVAAKNLAYASGGAPETIRSKEAIYGKGSEECGYGQETRISGVGERDAAGRPRAGATAQAKDFVPTETIRRIRCEIEAEKFDGYSPEQRREIEAVLGRSLEDYKADPCKEDIDLA
jgi:hypothetical protein